MRHSTALYEVIVAALVVGAAPLITGCLPGSPANAAAAWDGPPFSADIVDPAQPAKPPSRIYLGAGKLRLESTDTSSFGAIVFDPAHGKTLIVNDQAKSYIDAGFFTPLVAVAFAPMIQVLRPAGSGDPCTQWNTAINPFAAFAQRDRSTPVPKFTCRNLGAEAVNGRPAQKWGVTSNEPSDGPTTIWIDDRLHIMARSQDKNGTMEMRNVREGPQPDSLFTPPARYKKLSLTGLVGGMLHGGSDTGQSGAAGFLQKLQGATAH
jgi:hypothetical protein